MFSWFPKNISVQNVRYILIGLVSFAVLVGLIVCFFIAGMKTLTNNESVLLGVLMTFLSLFASWLLTHVYAEFSYQSASDDAKRAFDEKISTFARKAAEKVFNLSNEFDRLAENLKAALDDSEDEDRAKATVVVLREKMYSAIHILETLKSMNDTSLSDWQGIIGDDIQLQRQLQRQIEEKLDEQRQIITTLESRVDGVSAESADKRLREVEQKILVKMAALPFAFRPIQRGAKKVEAEVKCPTCNATSKIRTRLTNGATKLFQCASCKHFAIAKYMEDSDFELSKVEERVVTPTCHICREKVNCAIPDRVGASASAQCEKCGAEMTVSLAKDGIKLSNINANALNPEFLELVYKEIPQKPWPTGMHKVVAEKIGVANKTIERAIDQLIKQGRITPSEPDIAVLPNNGSGPPMGGGA